MTSVQQHSTQSHIFLLNNCTYPGRLSCCLSFNIPV